MKEFSTYENELLTKCWDENNKYKVNIDPETNEECVIEADKNKVIWNFGKSFGLAEKLLRYCDIEPLHNKL